MLAVTHGISLGYDGNRSVINVEMGGAWELTSEFICSSSRLGRMTRGWSRGATAIRCHA